MHRWYLALLLCQFSIIAVASEREELIQKGEYLVRAAGCVSCHTDHDNKGSYLAGGRALKTPFGTFYSPNITPDPGHGIGRWSDLDLIQALRDGVAPDGSHYYPAFPYTSYTRLKDDDIHAIATYLRSIKPVPARNREHELPWYLFRWVISIWKWLYFEPGEFRPIPSKDKPYNRGAYMVAIGHCTECHTPRDSKGVLDNQRYLAGIKDGVEGEAVPNITPDKNTGIGRWTEADLAYFLKTGELPDGDYSGSLMAEVIDDGTSHLNDEDLRSIALYLRSLPAIENKDFMKKKKKNKSIEDEW
ncbi:MAG: c-type cytochrome [Gammaproteobacteria bacterium]|nr:MAG: c-type cytochrome [Gammaproteobacteria bacterium]